jgi:oligoendopeptidase F
MATIEQLQAIARELEQKSARSSRLSWVHYTTGFDFGVVQAQEEATAVLRNKDHFRTVSEHRQLDLSPLDRRRVELLYQGFRPYHISDEFNRLESAVREKRVALSKVLNTHRSRLGGREVRSTEIAQVLRSSPDRALRKKAFLARIQVNRPLVEAGFLDLVRLRQELAAAYGAKDFVAYQLEMSELSMVGKHRRTGCVRRTGGPAPSWAGSISRTSG